VEEKERGLVLSSVKNSEVVVLVCVGCLQIEVQWFLLRRFYLIYFILFFGVFGFYLFNWF
jgi:hypothetical protein